jgi:Alpha/beta hydrolase domain
MDKNNVLARVCAAAMLVAALPLFGEARSAAERPPLPMIEGPVPSNSTSHAFSAAAYQNVPLDLNAQGYIEEEYLIRGVARVFDWGKANVPVTLGKGPYTTRILIRRPRDTRKFSGTVIVEPLNPSADMDLPIMWAQSHQQWMAEGDAWVGITIKPNTIRALKLFDSARYSALGFANPRSSGSCRTADINPLAGPATANDESGLAWDILSQVGAALKSRAATQLLGRPASRLYMTGQSQSAGYARTYASLFAGTVASESGGPLYDAYLYSGSPPWQVPVNQCRKDLDAADPRLLTPAVGVPVIELFAEGDIGTNISTRRSDSDPAPDLFRRYEIAGAAHVDPWEFRSFARKEDAQRAHGRISEAAESECTPRGVTPSDFPVRYVFDAAWRNLDAWVRKGTVPPRAERLQLQSGVTPFDPARAFVPDAHGNAAGGVRSTTVDVPLARYVGAKSGGFRCMFYGYKVTFDTAELRRLYPDRATYVQNVRARADGLVSERWLTQADRDALVKDASNGDF